MLNKRLRSGFAPSFLLLPPGTWTTGDFNLDGTVDAADLSLLASNYPDGPPTPAQLAQLTPSFAAEVERAFAAVPEPSAFGLFVGLAATGAVRRTRRRRPQH